VAAAPDIEALREGGEAAVPEGRSCRGEEKQRREPKEAVAWQTMEPRRSEGVSAPHAIGRPT
jgi:hypothetical protein